MPYAIKESGQFRTVTSDMALTEGETLYEHAPQWLIDTLDQQRLDLDIIAVEAEWRAGELTVIARQLEAIEEDEVDETPPDLMSGTRKEWLKYRGQVSTWKEGTGLFPDGAQRPIRPA